MAQAMRADHLQLARRLQQVDFQVDYGRSTSDTRFGPVFYGQYDDMAAAALVFPAPHVCSSTMGYCMDDVRIYNLKQAAGMSSGRSGMLQLKAIKLLHTGECAAIYEGFQCTLLEAIQSGMFKRELLRTSNVVTPMGGKVMFQMEQVLKTLLGQSCLHTEVDLTSLVVLRADASEVDIRLMPSPMMQRLVSRSSKGLVANRPAVPMGFAAPPEFHSDMAMGYETMVYLVYAATATVFMGAVGSVVDAASLRDLEPEYLQDKLCRGLAAEPSKRASEQELAGHYMSMSHDFGRQGSFIKDLGNMLQPHVRGRETHPVGKAMDAAGSSYILCADKLTSLEGGKQVARTLEWHQPVRAYAGGSKRAFGDGDYTSADEWSPSKVSVSIRHSTEHWRDKVVDEELRHALGLKLADTHNDAGDEFKSALMEVTFSKMAWRTWKILRDQCAEHVQQGSMAQYFRQHNKQQVDGRLHKADCQHSKGEPSVELLLKDRLDRLPQVPWVNSRPQCTIDDNAEDPIVALDFEEPDSPPAVIQLDPPGSNDGGDLANSTGDAGPQPDGPFRRTRASSSDTGAHTGSDAQEADQPEEPPAAAPEEEEAPIGGAAAASAAGLLSQETNPGTTAQGFMEAEVAAVERTKRRAEQASSTGRNKLSSIGKVELDILSGSGREVDGWRVVNFGLGCGEGRNGLVWRPLLPPVLAPSDLLNMVRTRSSLAAAIKWHQHDMSAPFTEHTLHLRSVNDDIIVTPLAGSAAVQAVAQHATCHLAAHGKPPTGSDRHGILAMERLYPDGYDDAEAGAVIDIMRLWQFRDAEHRRALVNVLGHPRVRLMQDLLGAFNAKQLQHHLAAMASCTCPVTWHLFASGLVAQEPSPRIASLQDLQLLALKHELAMLIDSNNASTDKLYLRDLAPRLLLTGPPAGVQPMPAAYASQRVQQKLWSDVLELIPRVSLTEALMGPDQDGKKAGLYYMLKTQLELPFKLALRSDALGPAAANLNHGDKVVFSMVNCTYLSTQLLSSDNLSSWRQQQGFS